VISKIGDMGSQHASSDELVAICTYQRSHEVGALLQLLHDSNTPDVCVVDSSNDNLTLEACERYPSNIVHIRAPEPSLARQRNLALDYAREKAYRIVHFIDDDSRPIDDYFQQISLEFNRRADVAGVGGIVVNQPPVRQISAKRFFLLYSNRSGRILKSGRNTIGHYDSGTSTDVEWLPGCAMSYRLSGINGFSFDSRLEGYSWGEDFDFSFRVSRQRRLRICHTAKLVHEESPRNRLKTRDHARVRMITLHRWVQEQACSGMRVGAFWWAAAGEITLRLVGATFDRKSSATHLAVVRGTLDGALSIIKSRSGE